MCGCAHACSCQKDDHTDPLASLSHRDVLSRLVDEQLAEFAGKTGKEGSKSEPRRDRIRRIADFVEDHPERPLEIELTPRKVRQLKFDREPGIYALGRFSSPPFELEFGGRRPPRGARSKAASETAEAEPRYRLMAGEFITSVRLNCRACTAGTDLSLPGCPPPALEFGFVFRDTGPIVIPAGNIVITTLDAVRFQAGLTMGSGSRLYQAGRPSFRIDCMGLTGPLVGAAPGPRAWISTSARAVDFTGATLWNPRNVPRPDFFQFNPMTLLTTPLLTSATARAILLDCLDLTGVFGLGGKTAFLMSVRPDLAPGPIVIPPSVPDTSNTGFLASLAARPGLTMEEANRRRSAANVRNDMGTTLDVAPAADAACSPSGYTPPGRGANLTSHLYPQLNGVPGGTGVSTGCIYLTVTGFASGDIHVTTAAGPGGRGGDGGSGFNEAAGRGGDIPFACALPGRLPGAGGDATIPGQAAGLGVRGGLGGDAGGVFLNFHGVVAPGSVFDASILTSGGPGGPGGQHSMQPGTASGGLGGDILTPLMPLRVGATGKSWTDPVEVVAGNGPTGRSGANGAIRTNDGLAPTGTSSVSFRR